MGWSNFIIIPELEVAIEISRHVNDEFIDDYDFAYDKHTEIDINKPIKDVSLNDITKLISYHKQIPHLDSPVEAIIIGLRGLGMKYNIISESQFYDNNVKYKNYKIKYNNGK